MLILGPVMRRGGEAGVGIWMEISEPAHVTVTTTSIDEPGPGAAEPDTRSWHADSFCVGTHHYALVEVDGLRHGSSHDYTVLLDDHQVWPDPALEIPPSRIERWGAPDPIRISGGSCRQQAPQGTNRRRRWFSDQAPSEPTSATDELGVDALAALAQQVQDGARPMPHVLLLTGDQVYADESHQDVVDHLNKRRGGPPVDDLPQVTTFEEYTWLYQRTWSHPLIRWLLSCVPTLMIFDDHDVIDDWNISDTWADDIASEPWWQDRLDSSLMSYWLYQHLGNMSAQERAEDELYATLRSDKNGMKALRSFAERVGSDAGRMQYSFSYRATTGPLQVAVLDARNGRVLEPTRRSMLSDQDWEFLDRALGDNPNTLLVSSVPWLLPPGVHQLERLVSSMVLGRFGSPGRRVGEKLRRAIDLEHWAAFGNSVESMASRLRRAATHPERRFPLLMLSGDVHFAYLAQKSLDRDTFAYQLVSSPLRQGDASYEQVARWAAMTTTFDTIIRRIAGWRHHKAPAAQHQVVSGVWTDNNIASLTYRDDGLHVQLDKASLSERGLELHPLLSRLLP